MLPDTLVDALVVAAEDDNVLLEGKLVGYSLGEGFPVRSHVYDLIVMPFGLEVIDAVENRLHHHHHSGVSAVGVVVHGLAAPKAVFAEVMYMDLHQALFHGPSGDGIA